MCNKGLWPDFKWNSCFCTCLCWSDATWAKRAAGRPDLPVGNQRSPNPGPAAPVLVSERLGRGCKRQNVRHGGLLPKRVPNPQEHRPIRSRWESHPLDAAISQIFFPRAPKSSGKGVGLGTHTWFLPGGIERQRSLPLGRWRWTRLVQLHWVTLEWAVQFNSFWGARC